jgi:hypothetical protein
LSIGRHVDAVDISSGDVVVIVIFSHILVCDVHVLCTLVVAWVLNCLLLIYSTSLSIDNLKLMLIEFIQVP